MVSCKVREKCLVDPSLIMLPPLPFWETLSGTDTQSFTYIKQDPWSNGYILRPRFNSHRVPGSRMLTLGKLAKLKKNTA